MDAKTPDQFLNQSSTSLSAGVLVSSLPPLDHARELPPDRRSELASRGALSDLRNRTLLVSIFAEHATAGPVGIA